MHKKRDNRERIGHPAQGTNYLVWGTEALRCSFKDVCFIVSVYKGEIWWNEGVAQAETHFRVGIHTGYTLLKLGIQIGCSNQRFWGTHYPQDCNALCAVNMA